MQSQVSQVQQGSEKVPVKEALAQSQVRVNRVPEKVLEKVPEALVQSQVRVNRVPEKVPEKVWEALVQSQVQQGFGEGPGEGSRKPWCKAKSGSTVCGEGCREGPGEDFGNLWARSGSTGSTGFPVLGFAARFRTICQNKTLRLLGIPPIFSYGYDGYHVDLMVTNGTFMILNESLMFHHTGYPPAIKRGNGQIEDFPVNT